MTLESRISETAADAAVVVQAKRAYLVEGAGRACCTFAASAGGAALVGARDLDAVLVTVGEPIRKAGTR